ncbi:hypothetical protein E3E12_08740 [Formicincola oecophyllae]|uniref:Uncharacterized protein n=1 Tax=Formicincola oecophyllae TaxID=2558361 RepID=A0A5B9M9R4_9PROT|nr:hypothetical protein [Formicincola oecophyllae]QEF95967.1 hypothetical protein E3E12_08740 [Formicincola oecophyllae]
MMMPGSCEGSSRESSPGTTPSGRGHPQAPSKRAARQPCAPALPQPLGARGPGLDGATLHRRLRHATRGIIAFLDAAEEAQLRQAPTLEGRYGVISRFKRLTLPLDRLLLELGAGDELK